MSEKDLAAELQASKDDPDEWGDPITGPEAPAAAGMSPKRRLAAMVSVRLSSAELDEVQARAAERGETVSAYLRGLAVRDISTDRKFGKWPALLMTSSEPYVSTVTATRGVSMGKPLTRTS